MTVVECDGNIEGLTPIYSESNLYKVSDLTPTAEEAVGAIVTVSHDGGEATINVTVENIEVYSQNIYSIDDVINVVSSQIDLGDGAFVSPGIYFVISGESFYVKSFEFGEIKTLDNKFIKGASGLTPGIIAPYEISKKMKTDVVEVSEGVTTYGDASKASMLETVPLYVVYDMKTFCCLESTNHGFNGKFYVTFVILDSGNNQLKKLKLTFGSDAVDALLESVTEIGPVFDEVIVKSSTSGSSKQFKLTVDDSGTISATEVTK